MGFTPKQLGHLVIKVRDLERAKDFYTRVMGLTVTEERPGRMIFMSANTDMSHELAIVSVGDEAPGPEDGRVGLAHMAWQMESFEDLKEIYQRLKDNDIRIKRVSDHGVSLGVYLLDHDDNELEVYYELPKSQWVKECWCIPPESNADFVCAMEDVLEVYQRSYGDNEVLVCMDETSKQQSLPPATTGGEGDARGAAGRAGRGGGVRLRIRAQWREQPVHAVCALGRMASGRSDGPPYESGLGAADQEAGGRGLRSRRMTISLVRPSLGSWRKSPPEWRTTREPENPLLGPGTRMAGALVYSLHRQGHTTWQ